MTGNAALKTAYSYCAGDAALYGAGATTPLVEKIVHGDNALSFAYSYDRLGNILTVSQYKRAQVHEGGICASYNGRYLLSFIEKQSIGFEDSADNALSFALPQT